MAGVVVGAWVVAGVPVVAASRQLCKADLMLSPGMKQHMHAQRHAGPSAAAWFSWLE